MSNTLIALLALCALFLSGCDYAEPKWQPDQAKRIELFQQCLKLVPAGPQTTHYNDWSEVVEKCERASYYQSLKRVE